MKVLWCNRDPESLADLLSRLGAPGCVEEAVTAAGQGADPVSFTIDGDCAVSETRPTLSGATLLLLGLPLDLNLATRRDLEAIDGFGPVLAQKIVLEREQNGPYCSVEELERVSGIGPKTVHRLRHLLAGKCE